MAPARFSFDFAVPDTSTVGLLLLYGLDTVQIDDYFWSAIELISSGKLRFHFRNIPYYDADVSISASTWYHIEYQVSLFTIIVYHTN